YMNKLYKEALPYLKKAHKLDPKNEEIKEMYEIAKEEVEQRNQPIIVEKGTGGAVVIAGGVKDKEMLKLVESVQKQQEKMIEAYTQPHDVLRQVITKSDEERKKLFEMLEKRDKAMQKIVEGQKGIMTRTLLIALGGGIGGLILIILIIMHFASRQAARREAMMMQAQERILSMMQQQQIALAQGKMQLQLTHNPQQPGYVTPKEMLNDANPRVRAKGIEIIEAELENVDSSVAEKILEPFLNDRDNRVRANACKVLYKHNPEKAFEKIKEMLNDGDRWMKISAAWVLGEIKDARGIDLLLNNLDTSEYHLKRMVLKSLKKIVQSPESKVDEEKKKEIFNMIKEIAIKERWVI
ncbi:MAG: HEAT repeat domain-containing protein, partial [Elusimicrobia bacterium]|nr:HEAT repeat domain-containing protein [Elusimicrobiota bacterium]